MAMSYSSLVAAKGQPGAIMSWVNYTKLDTVTVLDEAQSLLFSMLRVREMKTEWTFGLAVGQSEVPLPARFLDPDSAIYIPELGAKLSPVIEQRVLDARIYDNTINGDFAANPFTTLIGSNLVAAHEVAHGLTQGSTVAIAGVTAVGGLTMNGTFPVDTIVGPDDYIFDTGDNVATSSASGGGAAATYTANKLISSTPSGWAVWDNAVKFDTAFDTAATGKMVYYRSPLPLSTANQTNWLTTRYPRLLRVATQAAAADFMKDDGEYQKNLTALVSMVQSSAAENDLIYRGAVFGTETPHGG